MNGFDFFCRVVATFFGAGYSPKAPGTAGTFAALPLYLLIRRLTLPQYLLVAAIIVFLGIVASTRLEKLWGKDPSRVVIDEAAGVLIALISRPAKLRDILIAALVFRVFDITKPPPLKQLETLPGGFGIVVDDLAAGAMSALALAGFRILAKR